MTALPPAIAERILAEGGAVPFARFMELALTDPEAGYYARGPGFLGERGDFTTAPKRVPAFNRAVARFVADLIDTVPSGPVTVVEVGAGEGDLGAGILGWWTVTRPDLRDRVTYLVDDLVESSRRRLAAALAAAAAAGPWRTGVYVENGPPGSPSATPNRPAGEPIPVAPARADAPAPPPIPAPRPARASADADATGMVVSNELFDALPVHVVDVREEVPLEAWVRAEPDTAGAYRAVEVWAELSPAAAGELDLVAPGASTRDVLPYTAAGFLELRPAAGDLLRRWAGWYEDLVVFTVDYGDWLAGPSASEPPVAPGDRAGVTRYAGDLHRRSVRGYHRHRVTRDPYRHVGTQDLTADVDFRALSLHGEALGFETVLFAPLAAFLQACGAGEESKSPRYSLEADIEGAPLSALLDPDDLGGLFKVMLQVREKDDGARVNDGPREKDGP